MGVDCRIHLPEDVRVGNVTEAIGILAGLKPILTSIPSVNVKGATVKGYDSWGLATCANIEIEATPLTKMPHHVMYFFEPEEGGRLLCPRSTAFWLAVGQGLVTFFGGRLDFQDSDIAEVGDFSHAKPRSRNNPTNGREWDAFQRALYALPALTKADLTVMRKFAAYKEV